MADEVAPADSPKPPSAEPVKGKPAKNKPPKAQRTLPTERIAFPKQLEILRAYGQLGAAGNPVTNNEVASVVGLHFNTTSLANGFFADIGLLQRSADGQVASRDVIDFARAHQWDNDKAALKLAPTIRASWFATALVPKVQFRPHSHKDALSILADAAAAAPEHKAQLETLLEFMHAAGLIQLDGDHVRAIKDPASEEPTKPKEPTKSGADVDPPKQSSGSGAFQISLSITMADIATLPPEKIGVFFQGLGEVMKINADIERLKKGEPT